MDPVESSNPPGKEAELAARLAEAERIIAARDKTIHALVTREKDRAADRHSTFGAMEENASLQQVAARKTLELEAQNRKLEQITSVLQETSRLLKVLLDNTPVQIYFKDEESRFVRFSKSLQNAFLQSDPASIEGRTDFDFFVESYARETFEEEQAILRTGEPIVGKTEKLEYADGRVAWSLATKMPWRDKNGRIVGTFCISSDLTAIKAAEAELDVVHRQLVNASRLAGMAEIATNVLHNVGNVLNSVNISATLVADNVRKSRTSSLAKIVALLREHEEDLATFIASDPRGRQLPDYLATLSGHLIADEKVNLRELDLLRGNVDHIKEIVAMQQNYAAFGGVKEMINLVDLVEDAMRMSEDSLKRHHVEVIREFADVPPMNVEKHKILHILVNLIRNAKHACQDSDRTDKRLIVRVAGDGERARISVIDNGVGISRENLTNIFNHGFTTRKDGHGFGLHSGALAAVEMGGSLSVHSDGPGLGATFILELPYPLPQGGLP